LEYIRENFPNLSHEQSDLIAKLTRGNIYQDIKIDTEAFINTGKLPLELSHPTNTCDPANGNWTEHLLTFREYESYFGAQQYRVYWSFAPYDEWRNKGIKGSVMKVLNLIIKNIGHAARYISPAFIMVAVPTSQNLSQDDPNY